MPSAKLSVSMPTSRCVIEHLSFLCRNSIAERLDHDDVPPLGRIRR